MQTINITPTTDGYEQIAARVIDDLLTHKIAHEHRTSGAHLLRGLLDTFRYLAVQEDGAARVARLLTRVEDASLPMRGAHQAPAGDQPIPLTAWQLQTFAYHLSVIYREAGKGGLGRPDGASITYEIVPSSMSASEGDVWDGVTLDGHHCGNRHGGARAYARWWAGEADWWSAR